MSLFCTATGSLMLFQCREVVMVPFCFKRAQTWILTQGSWISFESLCLYLQWLYWFYFRGWYNIYAKITYNNSNNNLDGWVGLQKS